MIDLPPDYIDPEHKGQDLKLLEVFYKACRSEGGTADEIHLRGLKAVLALAQPEPEGPERLPPRVGHILRLAEIIRKVDGNHDKGAAALAEAILSHPGSRWSPAIQPVAVAARPWEREGWCDAEGRCWFLREVCGDLAWELEDPSSTITFGRISCLPHHALPIPQPTPGS